MSATKATPGPWLVHGKYRDEVWNAGGDVMVAHCDHDPGARPDGGEAEGFANAELIASAPEQQKKIDALADALEQVKAALGDRLLGNGPLSKEYAHGVMRQINAALLLAGRKP